MTADQGPDIAASGPIAYLTGVYPKVSHTFIQREVAALRALGAEVLTCTVRWADPKDIVGADQQAEAAATFCILDVARKPWQLMGCHWRALRTAPGSWFSALGLAWRTCPPGLKEALWQVFYFLEAGVLSDHLRSRGVVHLHNHFGDSSGTVTMLTSAISGIPFSYTMHGPDLFFEPIKWRIDAKTAQARFVVCISHFCRSQAMLFSDPVHWPKLKIVHCGVTPARYGQTPRDAFGKRVLFIGRLDAVKGGPLLLDAFATVCHAHPEAHLTVVGDGPARAALETQAAQLGLASAVTFAGYRSQTEVQGLLEQADMLVLPSFAEGVPMVLMEAMASRIPVIASRVAGVPELVEDGVTGFLVPPGDVASLTMRLNTLLGDPELCRTMGAAGRCVVEAGFDVDREAAWLLRLFRSNDPAVDRRES